MMGQKTSEVSAPEFIENTALAGRGSHYLNVDVNVAKVLASWKSSLFAYEWLHRDGRFKNSNELSAVEQTKRRAVEDRVTRAEPHQKPILGIGIMDNIEIGSGRATFLTLAALGAKTIAVHIPATHQEEFKRYLA